MGRSADGLLIAGGTPSKNSGSFTSNRLGTAQRGGGTGTELNGELLGLSGCLCLPVAGRVEVLLVLVCGWLGWVAARGYLWLPEFTGCLSVSVTTWVEWLLVVACVCLGGVIACRRV